MTTQAICYIRGRARLGNEKRVWYKRGFVITEFVQTEVFSHGKEDLWPGILFLFAISEICYKRVCYKWGVL